MDQPCQTLAKEPKNTLHIIYHSITPSDESTTNLRVDNTETPFEHKLQEISEQISLNGLTQTNQLTNLVVESVCVTSDYIALLLDNGRVCRISYKCKLNDPKSDSSSTTSTTTTSSNNVILNSQSNSSYRQNISRQSFTNSNLREAFIIPSAHDLIVQNSNSISSYPVFNSNSSRNRRHGSSHYNSHHILRGRVNSLIVGSSRIPTSILPASAVPESLIESVQTVLQSKSRSVIIRELQRTNLDVNLAVNNLLQRDDEGDDQTDDDDDPLSAVAVAAAAAAAAVASNNTTTSTNPPATQNQSSSEPYIHGDDLMSLLDINSNTAQNSEITTPNPNENDSSSSSSSSSGSTITSSVNPGNNSSNPSIGIFDEENFRLIRRFGNSIISGRNSESERDTNSSTRKTSSYRLRDNRWYESYRDELFNRAENEEKIKKTENTNLPKEVSYENTISFGENIQYWIEKTGDTPQFVKITSLYSELVAVSKDGKLHQWKWSSDIPFSSEIESDGSEKRIIYHPKSVSLGLNDEKIIGLSSSLIRGCCWTESGKISCWFDESVELANLTCKFETEATSFLNEKNSLSNEKIIEMSTSNLFTVFRTSIGSVYWWGLMPYDLRLKTIEKQQNKIQSKSKPSGSNLASSNEISVGSYVSLKSLPIFSIGTIGITVRDGQPLIGQLTEHVFSYRENKTYKFKLKRLSSLQNDSSLTSPTISSPQPQVIQGSLKRKKQYLTQESKRLNLDESRDESDIERDEREESWLLSDVFFMDDSKSSSLLGQVIKVDSDYVLVKMTENKNESTDLLDNTRIFSKTQLQVVDISNSSFKSTCDQFVQKNPKKLNDLTNVLTACAQQGFIHAILNKENNLVYVQYDISSGKFLKEKRFPANSVSSFCGSNLNNISLKTIDEPNFNLLTLFDGNSAIYPLFDLQSANSLKDPEWKNLFPIKSFSQSVLLPIKNPSTITGQTSKKIHFVTLFSMKIEQLMASILRCDLNRVYKILRQLENDLSLVGTNANSKRLKRIINERCDGNRNIIHSAICSCSPVSNNQLNIATNLSSEIKPDTSSNDAFPAQSSSRVERPWSVSFQNQSPKSDKKLNISLPSLQIQSFNNSEASNSSNTSTSPANMSVPFWPPPPMPMTQQDPKMTQIFTPVKLTEKEKMENSLKILHLLLNSPVINGKLQNKNPNPNNQPTPNINYLFDLLTHKNSNGETPFMYAINLRAYDAALFILEIALQIRLDLTKTILLQDKDVNFYNRDLLFTNMIYPIGSRTDQSPLYVLCSNDTCSFTWTGDNHITQDIFECKTCSLVGNLCCCTECARTCHKGHDCRIKKSSPTAYCDCWEKCKCKSLIAGDQEKRFELFDKLLKESNLLLNSMNKNGEHLLLSLIQTCSRQIQEQKNYRRHTGNSSASSASSSNSSYKKKLQIGEMPQHDLEPPKFSHKALQRIFTDFDSIKQIFMFNDSKFVNSSQNEVEFDESFYLENQSGCHDLDKFVFFLIQKCPSQLLITLVDSIKSTLQKETGEKLAKCKRVVQRLLNSVSRLFVILCIETSPANLQLNLENSMPNCPSTAKLIRQSKTENQISLITVSPIAKCEFVFKEFSDYACLELVNTANSLISPVILGLTKPTAFKLQNSTSSTSTTTSNTQTEFTTNLQNSLSDEIFNLEPASYRLNSNFISTSLVLPLEQINLDQKVSLSKSKKRLKSSGSFSSEILSESTEDSSTSDSSNDTSSAVKNGKTGRKFLRTKKISQSLSNIYEATNPEISDQSNLDRDESERKSSSEQNESDTDEDEDDDDDSDDFFKGGDQVKMEDIESENEEMDESEDESDEEIDDDCDFEFSESVESKPDKKDVKIEKPVENKKSDSSRIPIPTRTNRINSHVSSLIQQYGSGNTNLNEYYNFYSMNSSAPQTTETTTTTTPQLPTSNTSISTTTATSSSNLETSVNPQNTPSSVQITNNTLSRMFSILVKLIRELLNFSEITCSHETVEILKTKIDEKLKTAFKWINSVMDSTESQLRFGSAFSSIQLNELTNLDSVHYLRHLEERALLSNYYVNNSLPFLNGQSNYMNNLSSNQFSSRFGSGIDARRKLNIMQHQHQQNQSGSLNSQINSSQLISSHREFMSYTMSLMRRETNEHRDSLPQIDISHLKHVAYALDGFLFFMRHDKMKTRSSDDSYDSSSSSSSSSDESDDEQTDLKKEDVEMKTTDKPLKLSYRKSKFFKRSKSVLCVGGRSPDPFKHTIDDSLPLASKPHLLQPHSRIQDMFKCKTNDMDEFNDLSNLGYSLSEHLKEVIDDNTVDQEDENLKKFEKSIVKLVRKRVKKKRENDPNELLNKWRLTCDLFGRVFCDDIGAEIGSTIRQMAGFQLKESKFRREMERLKNLATKELIMEVEREREKLLLSTFKSLNNTFNLQCSRRMTTTGTTQPPPLCLSRIKVTFKDEQGEGTGVARSFYTAFSDAVLSDQEFPQFDLNSLSTCSKTSSSSTQYVPFSMQRYRNVRSSIYNDRNRPSGNVSVPSNVILRSSLRPREIVPSYSSSSSNPVPQPPETVTVSLTESNDVDMTKYENDTLPLFWQSDKKSANCFFYSPVAGKNSPARLNAFRNVGRIIGICLLQNELCPIILSRHVIKYILNRPVKWHDLAFYDSQMYESFRKMISDGEQFLIEKLSQGISSSKTGSQKAINDIFLQAIEQCNEQIFNVLDLSFNIDLPKEENTNLNVDLIENGSKVQVTCVNMYEFVKLYSEFRMIKNVEPCLKELKMGIFDVLPSNALDGLYPEDFRLLLNGVADINIHVLASYTTISDESKESSKRAQFEKWFWSTVDKMTQQEKQELLFFWTGSPYLPASEEGFQPLPTITLRPSSDQLLPTANTCINRLYIPIYSSKSILKSKLLLAIKTKTFGFV